MITVAPRRANRCSRARSRSPPGAPSHGYVSPWQQFDMKRIHRVLEVLEYNADPQLSFDQFCETVNGAAEHGRINRKSRSISHHLSTMARAITATIHSRSEPGPHHSDDGQFAWHSVQESVTACAQRVLAKKDPQHKQRTLRSLYEFYRNRCDDAAVRVMSSGALNRTEPWASLNSLEVEFTTALLIKFNDNIQASFVGIKAGLGSS